VKRPQSELAAQLGALLPQTQCRQCGFAGCGPYAEAIAEGRAGINQCPPGGDEGARELAQTAGVAYRPVDPRFGVTKLPAVALIDERLCIGCTLCIEACPVDAIVGAAKLMHTVIVDMCTGCELCIAPCPVDCISLRPTGKRPTLDERRNLAATARMHFERRIERLAGERRLKRTRDNVSAPVIDKQLVDRALARARGRLAQRRPSRK
jgi:electron transport complex protein RnfB